MALLKGSWEGADVAEEFIEHLRFRQKLPLVEQLEVRAAGDEVVPEPCEGEVFVFAEHFSHGFGLLTSTFFQRFCTHFGLQAHHLGPNSILQLSTFTTFYEGYLNLLPSVDI